MGKDNKTNENTSITWASILGGDILAHDFFKRQVNLMCLIVVFIIIYIDNRYSCQRELIEIETLKEKLTDIRYDALTISSELTERSRQSKIENYISEKGTFLETADRPPFIIKEGY